MTLISFVNFGIVAMTGLLLNMGSVGNSTMNQTVASDEAVESKGCAASFVCPLGTQPFYYNHNDYSESNVEDVTRWAPGYNPNFECDDGPKACLICVSQNFLEGEGASMHIKSNLEILTFTIDGNTSVSGANDPLFDFANKSN